jgi:hypothetical protein
MAKLPFNVQAHWGISIFGALKHEAAQPFCKHVARDERQSA